ncbi:venom serine protease inhibitor-like isoform X2 [Anticarsia gemmatalis]|uniref:venom serine protease inhibitor-like isoform X2 n=1 Tax=Anticarsia gemmatalis TaxID=129554 RepID=UPI003F77090A
MVSRVVISLFVVVIAYAVATPVDEKPLDCPEHEEYYKCSLEQCFKTCADLKNFPPCPSIAAGCYKPACLCSAGYLRNSEGVCVPSDKCS